MLLERTWLLLALHIDSSVCVSVPAVARSYQYMVNGRRTDSRIQITLRFESCYDTRATQKAADSPSLPRVYMCLLVSFIQAELTRTVEWPFVYQSQTCHTTNLALVLPSTSIISQMIVSYLCGFWLTVFGLSWTKGLLAWLRSWLYVCDQLWTASFCMFA